MTNTTNRIPNGALVQLDDRSQALAYADADGTYRTIQMNRVTRGDRVDVGLAPGAAPGASRDDRRPGR